MKGPEQLKRRGGMVKIIGGVLGIAALAGIVSENEKSQIAKDIDGVSHEVGKLSGEALKKELQSRYAYKESNKNGFLHEKISGDDLSSVARKKFLEKLHSDGDYHRAFLSDDAKIIVYEYAKLLAAINHITDVHMPLHQDINIVDIEIPDSVSPDSLKVIFDPQKAVNQ